MRVYEDRFAKWASFLAETPGGLDGTVEPCLTELHRQSRGEFLGDVDCYYLWFLINYCSRNQLNWLYIFC